MIKSNYTQFLEKEVERLSKALEDANARTAEEITKAYSRTDTLLSLIRSEYEGRVKELKADYEARIEALTQAAANERALAQSERNMFVDRLLLKAGSVQMYDTVPDLRGSVEHLSPAMSNAGFPPGQYSVYLAEQSENQLWADYERELRQRAAEIAKAQSEETPQVEYPDDIFNQ
jgi:hypothetical protein